jgi:hypothetical protein
MMLPAGTLTFHCFTALLDLVDADLARRPARAGRAGRGTAYFLAAEHLHLRDAAHL